MQARRLGCATLCLTVFAQLAIADDAKKVDLTDAEIAERLIGKWSGVEAGGRVKGMTHYKGDKTFEGSATLQLPEMTIKISVSGTWKIADGFIVAKTVKSSEETIVKVGSINKDLVLSIDDKVLTYKTESGKKSSRKRMPKKPKAAPKP